MRTTGWLLLDSDLFVLLSGSELLPVLIDALGFDLAQARRLDALPKMLERGPLASRYLSPVRQRAAAWCQRIAPLTLAPSPELHDRLLRLVDPGEALLLAAAVEQKGSLVATGDKRACRSLAAGAAPDLSAALSRRIVCLEKALDLILPEVGFPALVASLIPLRDGHQTLRVLLPQGERTPEPVFREGIAAYSADLAAVAGDLMYPGPGSPPAPPTAPPTP